MPGRLERLPDRPDAPVHHVRGPDDVGAGLGLEDGHAHQRRHRLVVQDHSVAHQPVVTERVVGVERDIGHHRHLGHRRLDRPDRPVGQVAGVPGLGAVGRALRRIGVGKQAQRGDAEAGGLLGGGHRPVHRPARHPGHRGDRLLHRLALAQEDRRDQVAHRQPAPPAARSRRAAVRRSRRRRAAGKGAGAGGSFGGPPEGIRRRWRGTDAAPCQGPRGGMGDRRAPA